MCNSFNSLFIYLRFNVSSVLKPSVDYQQVTLKIKSGRIKPFCNETVNQVPGKPKDSCLYMQDLFNYSS